MLNDNEIKEIEKLCKQNRRNIIKMVNNAQSGHIGGSLSSTEIMTVLFHKCMKLAPKWKDDKIFFITTHINFSNRNVQFDVVTNEDIKRLDLSKYQLLEN